MSHPPSSVAAPSLPPSSPLSPTSLPPSSPLSPMSLPHSSLAPSFLSSFPNVAPSFLSHCCLAPSFLSRCCLAPSFPNVARLQPQDLGTIFNSKFWFIPLGCCFTRILFTDKKAMKAVRHSLWKLNGCHNVESGGLGIHHHKHRLPASFIMCIKLTHSRRLRRRLPLSPTKNGSPAKHLSPELLHTTKFCYFYTMPDLSSQRVKASNKIILSFDPPISL
ncbi:uncharacterized protein LOC116266178 [Nymphaea colorata]|nr:uncharacterized protein LOC116266178 [Nymphaea colorata]